MVPKTIQENLVFPDHIVQYSTKTTIMHDDVVYQ